MTLPNFISGLFRKKVDYQQNQNAQEKISLDKMSFIQKFDKIVSEDTTPVKITTPLTKSIQTPTEDTILHYDKDKKYDSSFYIKLICSDNLPQEKKITFVKDALMDKEKDLFKFMYSKDCSCLEKQTELAEIFANHFKEISLNSNNNDGQYQYLKFVTKNGLPGSIELIEQYFSERDNKEHKYWNETELPLYMARKGYYKRALELVELFVDEQERGLINSIFDGYYSEKNNIFTFLGLLEDSEISKRAIELGFRYYNNITMGYTYNLSKFLKYIDTDRYKNSLKLWLDKYEKMDTSVYSNNNGYCSLLAGDGLLIAEEMGYAYWIKYVNSKDRWKDSNLNFEIVMLDIALACMKGKCSGEQKRDFITFIQNNHRFFMKDETLGDTSIVLLKFLKILSIYKPDISMDEMKNFLPERYERYYWKGIYNEFIKYDSNETKPKTFDERVQLFEKHGFYTNIHFSAYDKFLGSIGELSDLKLLEETGNLIWFDTEGGFFPLDYSKLFNETINPVLLTNDIKYITIHEEKIVKDGSCIYTIIFSTNECAYRIQFENGSDWYEVKTIVKAINLALKDTKSNLRLIYIGSVDQATILGLFDPDKFIPLAEDLGLSCYAVDYNDELMAKQCFI